MFTGLVRALGCVREIEEAPQAKRFFFDVQGDGDALDAAAALSDADLEVGASVCVNGVCLTVVASQRGAFAADAAFETLRVTTLGSLEEGSWVNLEPSLRTGDALGGHMVSGHVDGTGEIVGRRARGDACELWIECPPGLARFLAPKGSICVSGISLTVNDVRDPEPQTIGPSRFMVGIIPHTLQATTLGDAEVGTAVNLEVDLLARYVDRISRYERSHGKSQTKVDT